MGHRPTRGSKAPSYGSALPALSLPRRDPDAVMRETLRREAVENMAHQLEVERVERARLVRGDTLMSAVLVGGTVLFGMGLHKIITGR